MTYDEAKIKAFEELIPPVGAVFVWDATGRTSSWEVRGPHEDRAAFRALRSMPFYTPRLAVWSLTDYWEQLNSGRATRVRDKIKAA